MMYIFQCHEYLDKRKQAAQVWLNKQ